MCPQRHIVACMSPEPSPFAGPGPGPIPGFFSSLQGITHTRPNWPHEVLNLGYVNV